MSTSAWCVDLARELHTARQTRTPITKLTERRPGLTREDAYQIQAEGIRLRQAAGERVVGGKLGFTSSAMRQAMGVDSPNYGWLTDAMLISNGIVELDELIHPKVEPEIAFELGADLDNPLTTADDVRSATRAVMPCLEVVDSRFENFEFLANDNISDNSSAGVVVLGSTVDPPADLSLIGLVVSEDGRVRFTAAGAASLDDPCEAVAWMARATAGSARPLRAGDIVISGGLTAPLNLEPGSTVTVQFDRIGTCELSVRS